MENTRTKRRFTKKTKDNLFVVGMLALPLAGFIVFYLFVNFNSILLAFQTKENGAVKWGFGNFKKVVADFSASGSSAGVLFVALKNTFRYFFSGLLITLPLSFALCYFLYKRIAGYKFFRVVFYLPHIIAASVYTALFRYFIAVNGPLAEIVNAFGWGKIPPVFTMSKYATSTILFYCVFTGLGGNLILFSGAMSNIDESLVEAAKIDGAGMWTEMAKIVIPLIWPTLSTVLIFQFTGIFSASGPILLFVPGGEFDTYTLSYWIFRQIQYYGETNYPSAVGLLMTAVGAPIALLMRRVFTKLFADGE